MAKTINLTTSGLIAVIGIAGSTTTEKKPTTTKPTDGFTTGTKQPGIENQRWGVMKTDGRARRAYGGLKPVVTVATKETSGGWTTAIRRTAIGYRCA